MHLVSCVLLQAEVLIMTYFRLGFTYAEILACLARMHGVIVSMRTLKRSLKRAELFRRKHKSDILDVALFIIDRLQGIGSLHGHRWMHAACIQSGYVISHLTG